MGPLSESQPEGIYVWESGCMVAKVMMGTQKMGTAQMWDTQVLRALNPSAWDAIPSSVFRRHTQETAKNVLSDVTQSATHRP